MADAIQYGAKNGGQNLVGYVDNVEGVLKVEFPGSGLPIIEMPSFDLNGAEKVHKRARKHASRKLGGKLLGP